MTLKTKDKEFVDCTKSESDYINMLKDKGVIGETT